MRNLFLIVSISLFLFPESFAQSWNKDETDIFIESCISEAKNYFTEKDALEYCTCTMMKIMQLYPNVDDVEKMTGEELNSVAERCIPESMGEENKWTEETKSAFIDGCEGELQGSGIDVKVYCPCALKEVMQLYQNPFDSVDISQDVLYQIAEKCLGQ